MLVLLRKVSERIVLSNGVTITVVEVRAGKRAVRLGIDAPSDVKILREELLDGRKKTEH